MSMIVQRSNEESHFKKIDVKPKNYPREYKLETNLWTACVLVSIFLNFFITSFSYIFLKRQMDRKIFYVILIFDTIYLADYIASLIYFICKYSKFDVNRPPTRSKFVLIIDFFLAFPASYIYETFSYDYFDDYVFLSLKGAVLLRSFHLMVFFTRKWNSAGINHVVFFGINFLAFSLILVQTTTCIWYGSAFSNNQTSPWKKIDDLSDKYQLISEKYIICIYYVLGSITSRNFGDIVPIATRQKILAIVIICFGFVVTTGLFVGTLSFLLDNAYKRRTNLRREIRNVISYFNLSRENQNLVKNYYKILWSKKKGIHEAPQLTSLPYPLKCEITVDINIDFLQISTLFRNKPVPFLRMISTKIKHEFYQAGEHIYRRNAPKNKMIFVLLGTIEILSEEDDETPIIKLKHGTCLGENALILKVPAKCSVRATAYTELQVLYQKDFYTIIEFFPDLYKNIREIILERITDAESQEVKRRGKSNISFLSSKSDITHMKAIKDKLKGKPLKSEQKNQFLALYRLKEDYRENSLCISEKFPWILNPNGSLRQLWEALIILVVLIISVAYPYYIIFLRSYPWWFQIIFNFIDLVLVMDVLIILTTAIEERNRTVKTFVEITQKRLTQVGFYLDFFAAIKIELFYWIWTKNRRFKDVLKLNRLVKVYRISKLIRSMEDKVELNLPFLHAVRYIFYLLLFGYWFGAFLYLVTCLEDLCTEDGWFFTKLMELTVSFTSHEILTSVYFALSCLSGLTSGDVIPTNTTDMLITCFTFICGIFAFSCCVALVSTSLTRSMKVQTDFQDILFMVLKSLKITHMPEDLVRRVKNYLVLHWCYDKASILKKEPLLFEKNTYVQRQIQINEKMENITNIPLFEAFNEDFLLLIASRAKTLILPPNEFVTYKGEVSKILYIIVEGYCIRQFEKSFVVLKPKSFFGTMCVFSNVNSICTVKTLTHVKLLCITEEFFWKSASIYPIVFSQLVETTQNFDLLDEFKKIPIQPTINEITDLEEEIAPLKGSFVNVISYCKKHGETYCTPFQELGFLCWTQLLMLPICILPYGLFLKVWMSIRLTFAFITALLIPYQIIQTDSPFLDKLLFAADFIAYADLYIMLFVGYYKKEKNQIVIHPMKTAAHYLKGRFIIDFVLCFPWEIIVSYVIQNRTSTSTNLFLNFHLIIKMIRIGQIYRFSQFFNYSMHLNRKINSNALVLILKYVPLTFILINVWAAVVILNSCKYDNQDGPPKDINNKSVFKSLDIIYCDEDSWIDRSKFRNFTEIVGMDQVYILSIYFCTQILTLCGLGDIVPRYTSTLTIVIIMILCGILFIGYIYAKIASQRAHRHSLLFQNQEMLSDLKRFMAKENVRNTLQNQIIQRVEYRWKREQGLELNRILSKLHPALYQDTVYTKFESTLREVPIFENVDRSFLRVFVKFIGERYHYRQETIYKVDDIISEICIIERGVVRIVSKSGRMEVFMESGGIFGNLTPNARHKISVTATAVNNVDILYMDSEAFFGALETDASSVNTFTSLEQFRDNVLGCFSLCLPWKLFHVTIPHHSMVLMFFDIYCLALTHISTIFLTYEFAFQDHHFYLLCFAIYVDVTFMAKIIVEMHQTYENRYGETITSNRKIFIEYFHNRKIRRFGDLAINFPFYYVAFFAALFSNLQTYLVFSCLRMITVFRLLYFFDYYNEKSNLLMTRSSLLKFGALMIWGTLVIHVLACGWYLCACPLTFCTEDSWLNKFMANASVDNYEKFDIYVACAYFTITIITKTGPGDIVANNIQEQIYVSVVMICAIFLIGIFIGEIWNILTATTVARVKYDDKINTLRNYLENMDVSSFQMKKMWRYIQQLWSISRGNQLPDGISQLHSATLHELVSEIYSFHLKNSYVFSDVEESFARQLCQYFRRTIFFPGNYIVQHGDIDNTMYFVHNGEVDILTVHSNLTEIIHEVLHRGDMFGVIQGLYYNVPHHFSFRARTTVHVVGLRLSDWEHLLDFFPASKDSIFTKTNRVNV